MKPLTTQQEEFLQILAKRFVTYPYRHRELSWSDIEERLRADDKVLWSLQEMERTGGEPDVIGYDAEQKKYIICDCVAESPKERRSLCYDRAAWERRKQHKPTGTACDMAAEMGVRLVTEQEYRQLQEVEEVDQKTSSWLETPTEVRTQGGAIFGDRRYGRVFVYHNGADSYYGARGWRGIVFL